MTQANVVEPAEIARALRVSGLAGRPVCLHSSLRSFGVVAGGADGVLDAFLAARATLMVSTASVRAFAAPRPPGHRPLPFNCEDDGSVPAVDGGRTSAGFSVASDDLDPEMGAIPAAVLRRPDRRRGDHPLSSFTALGTGAADLVAGQSADDVFAPLRALVSRGGAVLLAGIGLTSATMLHLAEEQAGLRLLVRWAYVEGGRVVAARHGGCSRGFERLVPELAAVQRRAVVGRSHWRIFDAAHMLAAAVRTFRADPGAGACGNPACCRCREQLRYGKASRFGNRT